MVSHSRNLKYKSRGSVVLVALLVLCIATIGIRSLLYAPEVTYQKKTVEPPPVTLLFVGDVMMDRGVRSIVTKYFEGDYSALFRYTPYIARADISFANLEGPVATESSKRTGSKFSFRMDPTGLTAMKDTGFDVVSFSNNHVGDYSTKAFLETLSHLKNNNIMYAGAGNDRREATTPAVFTTRGLRVGYLAFSDVGPTWLQASDEKPGIITASDPELSSIISDTKTHVDVLVVSFHWGDEYSLVNDRQRYLARQAVDAGADIVVGHHPHVMQEFEYYKDKLIFYSLGNFIFDQYFSKHTMQGMVASVSIDPYTKALSTQQWVSQLDTQYIPQPLIPFDQTMLSTKRFIP